MPPKVSQLETDIAASKKLGPGGEHYRAYVGPPAQYDLMGATQFNLLSRLGLREQHALLDIGCGSLRAGRLLIQFLLPNRYCGIEPNDWLWQQAIKKEIGADLIEKKMPRFDANTTFRAQIFKQRFDFIIAQSIFSHTGADMLTEALENSAAALRPTGQMLFTVLDETTPSYDQISAIQEESGWIYPGCVSITQSDLIALCETAGLFTQRLPWLHQRQRWYRATLSQDQLLNDAQLAELGTGRPLFNSPL